MAEVLNPQGISSIRAKDLRSVNDDRYKFVNSDIEFSANLKAATKDGAKIFFPNMNILNDNSW
ncbi:MAG: hypothetical protein FWE23_03170 [Chitinivibrionia bacterium]|nr:hypothetical protein [Chitinivibrionia bacterium]